MPVPIEKSHFHFEFLAFSFLNKINAGIAAINIGDPKKNKPNKSIRKKLKFKINVRCFKNKIEEWVFFYKIIKC